VLPLAEGARIPGYGPLMLWAKFRLLHGLRTGQPVEAARDVRQLAWLAYRSDTVVGGAIAKALPGLERHAYDSLSAPAVEWRPMSPEQLEWIQVVIMSSLLFSNIAGVHGRLAAFDERCFLRHARG